MSNLLDLLISGLATGAIYAIVAVGFTLLWQTSQTINFAQGEFVMLPAFLMLAAMHAGVPFWLAIIIGMLASMLLLGLGFKLLLVDPMLRHGVLPLAIATMALAIGIKEAVEYLHGARARDSVAEAITINTRQYAKRQQTWFRHQLTGQVTTLDATRAPEKLASDIAAMGRKFLVL